MSDDKTRLSEIPALGKPVEEVEDDVQNRVNPRAPGEEYRPGGPGDLLESHDAGGADHTTPGERAAVLPFVPVEDSGESVDRTAPTENSEA